MGRKPKPKEVAPLPPIGVNAEDKAVKVIRLFKNTKGEYAGKPFNLHPWQENEIIRPLFRRGADGTRQIREGFIFLPRKNGKALAVDTPILTPAGWSTMGALQVGDQVYGMDGKPTAIVATSETFTDHPCYRVEFSDGRSVIADAGHLWTVWDKYLEREITVGTEVMAWRHLIGSRVTHRERRYSVERPEAVDLPARDLPIDPYVLGAWLGDGTSARGEITFGDAEIEEGLALAGYAGSYRYHRGQASTVGFPGLVTDLRSVGVLDNKHIPADYLLGSIEQRRALLAGLVDTDGGVCGQGSSTQIEFCSTNRALADGVLFLVRSLGGKATLCEGRATLYGKDCGPKYRILWAAFREDSPFRIARKTARLAERRRDGRRCRSESVQIAHIDPVETVPTRCIQVANPDGMYLAGEGLMPTHNSELCAAIGLFLLLFDGEQGGEVYLAATDKDQASIVFGACKAMVMADPALQARCQVIDSVKRIVVPSTNSFLRAIPADEGGAHGFNASAVIYDELHAAPNRDLYDVLRTSQGSRRQPLFLVITTAGFDKNTICYERYEYACKVRDGLVPDPTFLPVIYEAPAEADWKDEAAWMAANPGMTGPTPFRNIEEMRRMAKEAQEIPAMQNAFRRLYLNQWTESVTRWIDREVWDRGAVPTDALEGRACFAGLDLASTTDIAALALVFPADDGYYDLLMRFWVPKEGARKRAQRDRVPYPLWINDGLIKATDGDVIDYDVIRQDIRELGELFQIKEIAVDRWNAQQITTQLQGDGFTMVPFGQGFQSLSAPTKELEKLALAGKIRHGGNKVLAWMVSNVAIEQDAAGNQKPSKKKSTERIDGVVATIMALGRANVSPISKPSIYETRGLFNGFDSQEGG